MMKKILTGVFLMAALGGLAQNIEMVSLDQLHSVINAKSDRIKVLNFWASWCGPCIKEMPHFEQVSKEKNFDLYFVSLDFPSQREKALKMLDKNNIQAKSFLLNEKDSDKYIASIHNEWTGAIPATLFVQTTGEKIFYEKALSKNELETIVNKLAIK